ncbi:S8 family peptidase [Schlesneria paludicola]|uniref:S8 family peptidase n=1 Tax=Schlesneria paludicola TaxID=360056 RepID=UPI0012FCCB1E|nr:S8 family peptidase [Schlesneria paludicola]
MHLATRIGIAAVSILFTASSVSAEKFAVKTRPSRHKKLAPELDVLRHCNSRYKGVCRNGKAVFDVPSGQKIAMQSMSISMVEDDPAIQRKAERLIIRYTDLSQKPTEATMQAAGLRTVEDYERGAFLVVEPVEEVTSKTVEALIDDDNVVHAAPDYVLNVKPIEQGQLVSATATSTVPNDPLFANLWGMTNLGATLVWPTFRETPKVVVAVIDTGVDYNHPDLKANMWSKNGKFGFDFYDDDDDPMDEQNHGTHCAGTIAGVGNNGVGVVGVTWKAQIMALRFLGPDGNGNISDAVKAIDWAVANGAHIISNSWAGPETAPALSEAITRAEQRGVLFVAAAGNSPSVGNNNDKSPYYPAACKNANIITVGAIDKNDKRGSFSHYGPLSVDIGAPGVAIVSTVRNSQYAQYDGTSMATPHVAGAAAMVWASTFSSPAQDRTQMAKVRDLIYENARPVPALKGWWGESAPARVSGGVLDISFLARGNSNNPSPSNPSDIIPVRRLVENRMKVDPSKLR